MLEQEVKLQYESAEAARRAVAAAGGRLTVARRLIDDCLFDTSDGTLGRAGTALRVRRDGNAVLLTFKGPMRAGPVKSRDEIQTSLGDAAAAEAVLAALGFRPVFRSQKYREEYSLGAAVVTVDEAPLGVYVEIEADADEIGRVSRLLGRTPADYRLESYPALWRRWCADRGLGPCDMIFGDPAARP